MAPTAFIALLILSVVSCGDCRKPGAISEEQDYNAELEKRLQTLNKPPVKTIIYKETGNVIDCVRITEQPALAHPALKNHKIQLHPIFSTLDDVSTSSRNTSTISVKLRGTRKACPDGTVPIKRTTKEDLIRYDAAISKEFPGSKAQGAPVKKANVRFENQDKIYGSYVEMALYNLTIADDQESSVDVTLENGPPGQADVLSVGWKVSKSLNGDGLTRLFGYWHEFSESNGCYNTLCPGFVQIDQEIFINYALTQTSVYGDETQQYTIFLYLEQAVDTGHWWLRGGDDKVNIGYWPKNLFQSLADGANAVAWGGTTSPGANGDYPPMGNGHLPNNFYKDTCYFNRVKYVKSDRSVAVPFETDTKTNIDGPNTCYDLKFVVPDERLIIRGFAFMFGGPGGKYV